MQLFSFKIKHKKRKITTFVILLFGIFFLRERNLVLQTLPGGNIDILPQSDCGVVLTGSAKRIRESFEIMNLGKVNKLIISGVYKNTQLHEIFPQLPFYPGIKAENVILEKISGSTHQNAIQSLQVVQILKCKNILLITSQLHMSRALRTFKANFPTDFQIRTYATENPGKDDEWTVFIETIKSMFYSLAPYMQLNT